MKKFVATLGLLAGLASQSGCITMGRPVGLIYTNYDVNHNVTQNKLGTKTGESCAKSVLGLFAWGDASAATAARAAGINTIASVDDNLFSVLGIFESLCTRVSGD